MQDKDKSIQVVPSLQMFQWSDLDHDKDIVKNDQLWRTKSPLLLDSDEFGGQKKINYHLLCSHSPESESWSVGWARVNW
jgi:hypothetical protein